MGESALLTGCATMCSTATSSTRLGCANSPMVFHRDGAEWCMAARALLFVESATRGVVVALDSVEITIRVSIKGEWWSPRISIVISIVISIAVPVAIPIVVPIAISIVISTGVFSEGAHALGKRLFREGNCGGSWRDDRGHNDRRG